MTRLAHFFPLLLALAACGSADPPPAPALPVVVHAAVADDERLGAALDEFTADTGIPVELHAGESGELTAALIDKTGDPADVFVTDQVADIWRAGDRGALRPVASRAMAEHHVSLRDPDGSWFVLAIRPFVIATGNGEAAAVSYYDLGNPPFAGKVCLASATLGNSRIILAHLIETMGVRDTERLVRRWVRNLATVPYASESGLRNALQSGACEYAVVSSAHLVFANWEKMPSPPIYAATAVGVGRHAANPVAAQALADWLLRNASVRIPSYADLPQAGIAGWRDEEARLLADRAGYR